MCVRFGIRNFILNACEDLVCYTTAFKCFMKSTFTTNYANCGSPSSQREFSKKKTPNTQNLVNIFKVVQQIPILYTLLSDQKLFSTNCVIIGTWREEKRTHTQTPTRETEDGQRENKGHKKNCLDSNEQQIEIVA